ncbi:MAG: SDR family NAD(P)-dependent oxidoreductase [Bacteroidetes bacterium]|nr:SDR family NAD(P)-dependent oxidoreductase [Bacteroidota bacterium]
MIDKKAHILVTGGTGFIGSYILRHLLDKGYESVSAFRRKSSRLDLVADFSEEINWIECDLRDAFDLNKAISDVDYIIHAAAKVSFHKSDRDLLYEINVEGTANLVNFALKHQVKKLIHVSSVAAIGRKDESNIIDEDVDWQKSRHNSNYAISKHLAEMEVWRGASEGLDVAVLNPANVMGSGFWNEGTARTFQQIWDGFPFYTSGMTGYVDVRDVARFSIDLLESDIKGERFILSENDYSYKHIFELIARALNKKAPGIKVKKWMVPFARIGDWVKSKMAGKRPFLSREIAHNAFQRWKYVNEKSREALAFEYTPIPQTIMETARQFKIARENGMSPSHLPFKVSKTT